MVLCLFSINNKDIAPLHHQWSYIFLALNLCQYSHSSDFPVTNRHTTPQNHEVMHGIRVQREGDSTTSWQIIWRKEIRAWYGKLVDIYTYDMYFQLIYIWHKWYWHKCHSEKYNISNKIHISQPCLGCIFNQVRHYILVFFFFVVVNMNDCNHTTQHHHDQAKKYLQLVVSQYVEILRIQSYNTIKKMTI